MPSPIKRILFLYEGDTEEEFFPLFWKSKSVQVKPDKSKPLKGIFNFNKKVANAIFNFLEKNLDVEELYVVVQHDREGKRNEKDSELDIKGIMRRIDDSRLIDIHDLVLTQMLESLFFIDIDGIYKFLKAPKANRTPEKYKNHEDFTHKHLNDLFRQISKADGGKLKEYKKGRRTENFISNLDLDKIYNNCPDLQAAINFMKGIKK